MRAVKDSLPAPYMEKLKNQKGLARRPQSKAPHALAWCGSGLDKSVRMDVRREAVTLFTKERKSSALCLDPLLCVLMYLGISDE